MPAVDIKQAPARLGRLRVGSATPARDTVWQRIWRDRLMLLLIAPGVLFFVMFRYLPLVGNIIAFEDYLPVLGVGLRCEDGRLVSESPFVGFANFQAMANDSAFWQAVTNTVIIFVMQMFFYF